MKNKCLVKVLFVAETSKRSKSESNGSLTSSDVFHGMKPYRKPIFVENQRYTNPILCVPKISDLTQKVEQSFCFKSCVHKFKKKKKKKKKSKSKLMWVPKKTSSEGVPPTSQMKNVIENSLVKRKISEVFVQRRNFLKHWGWYNVLYENFDVPTKKPRYSGVISTKMVWVPKKICQKPLELTSTPLSFDIKTCNQRI